MGQSAVVANDGAAAPGAPPIVCVSGFCKRYRKKTAVSDVALEIRPGEIYGLIGPDGAGKSSLMKAIAGVLSFEKGAVTLFGTRITSDRAAESVKQRIGFMPQGLGLNLYLNLSVEENIDFFARMRLVPKAALARRKDKLLRITRLDRFRDRPMKNLSGGMKQKLGLVCTLIHEPALVILDEPTTGVDPVSRRDFWSILSELLREQGITALVSTAYMDEASRFHRMSLMFAGNVVAQGEPEAIQALVPGCTVDVTVATQTQALARLREHFPQVETFGPTLRVFVEEKDPAKAAQQIEALLKGHGIKGIQAMAPELEDVFVALLRHKQLVQEEALPAQMFPDGPAAAGPAAIAIEASGLTKNFGSFCAVDHIDFKVRQGEIFGLLGANGAGKTTAIKMLTGILKPSSGSGQVAGADMRRAGKDIKSRIGYMSQLFSLYLDLTVVENIRLYSGIYGLDRKETRSRMHWVVDMAGLAGYEHMLAGRLPMGVRQRLALGCALVHRPQVVFLDEPTSGVDPVGRRRFWDVLFRLSRQEGVSILLTTHYMSESEHCDHLALMYAGRIVADASPQEMKKALEKDAGHLVEITTDKPLAALSCLEKADFNGVVLFGKRIHLLSPEVSEVEVKIRAALEGSGVKLQGVTPRPLSMEDVFVYRILALENKAQ